VTPAGLRSLYDGGVFQVIATLSGVIVSLCRFEAALLHPSALFQHMSFRQVSTFCIMYLLGCDLDCGRAPLIKRQV